jgi:hypothetical protein
MIESQTTTVDNMTFKEWVRITLKKELEKQQLIKL